MTKLSNHVMRDNGWRWVKQMSPRVDHLFITGDYFMSNQNCGWKRETTVCHSWISKDGDLAAWLERTNQAEWRYEISWVHVSRVFLGRTVTSMKAASVTVQTKRPRFRKQKSQVKVAGQKTTARVWKWTWEVEDEETQERDFSAGRRAYGLFKPTWTCLPAQGCLFLKLHTALTSTRTLN